MTATDELRRMLDERGVEWRRTPHYSSESIDNETTFEGNGIEWHINDHMNGRIGLRALRYEVTPEQAIEATLGRGTCRDVRSARLAALIERCDETDRLIIDTRRFADLEDENARLRSCLSDDAENARMIMAENAKLRELVRALYMCSEFLCGRCKYGHGNTCDLDAENELRELGIEVGE